MRVLLCIPTLAGGGAERQLWVLARALKDIGVEVHVASAHGGVYDSALRTSGIPVTVLRPAGNHHPGLLFDMWRLVRKIKPDLVHTFLLQMDVVGGLAAKASGVPFIMSERVNGNSYRYHWKTVLRRQVAKWSSAIVTNSAEGAEYWSGYANVVCINNGIPFNYIDKADKIDLSAYRGSLTPRVIVSACRFHPQKNIDLHVDAVARVLQRDEHTTAFFLGTGPRRHALQAAFAPWIDARRMVFAGYQEQPWSWFKAADVFVSVSHYEGMPNSVLEAAACRVPLVLSDIPEHRALFDDRSAFFCDRDDPRGVADAITSALSDRATARRRAERAYEIIAPMTPEAMAGRYRLLYATIVGPASTPRQRHQVRNETDSQKRDAA